MAAQDIKGVGAQVRVAAQVRMCRRGRLRGGDTARGTETPRTELREQGYVCGGPEACAARVPERAGAPGGASGGSRNVGCRLELWAKTCRLKPVYHDDSSDCYRVGNTILQTVTEKHEERQYLMAWCPLSIAYSVS